MPLPDSEKSILLPWDSELFGFPVGLLGPESLDGVNLAEALKHLKSEGVRLVYASPRWGDGMSRALLEGAGAVLVDHKMVFRKAGLLQGLTPEGVTLWPGSDCPPELEALALTSGHLSRFRLDPRVPAHVFRELYSKWMQRSVRLEIADGVLVARMAGTIAGMVTLAIKGDRGRIGLLAVADAYQGQGIGRRLIAASEAFCVSRGVHILEVATQGANQGACSLYGACGFALADEAAMYHIWIENCLPGFNAKPGCT
jgi:dTDP-4-amino-4,6-dideoxy-D-galactose acyltransferase